MNKELQKKVTQENAAEICKRISADSEMQAQEIVARAGKEAARILEEAGKEARNNKEALFREADKALAKIKERVSASLNLEKKRVIMGEKERFVEAVLGMVKKLAEEFRAARDYPAFLKKSIAAGIEVIGDYNVEIFYSFQDEKIFINSFSEEIQNVCRDTFKEGVSMQFVKSDFKDIGVIVQSKDGRLISDRRFLSLLKTAYEDVYMRLLKEAF